MILLPTYTPVHTLPETGPEKILINKSYYSILQRMVNNTTFMYIGKLSLTFHKTDNN